MVTKNSPEFLYYKWQSDELIMQIHLQPKASRDAIVGQYGNRLKIAITAPPVDGKANLYLIKFLAKQFGVSQKQVTIIRGEHSRDKTICINKPTKTKIDNFEFKNNHL